MYIIETNPCLLAKSIYMHVCVEIESDESYIYIFVICMECVYSE